MPGFFYVRINLNIISDFLLCLTIPIPVKPFLTPKCSNAIFFPVLYRETISSFMVPKIFFTVLFVFLFQETFGQTDCSIKTRFSIDGALIKYIEQVTIDNSSEEICSLGIETTKVSNYYVKLYFSSAAGPKLLEGDLNIVFSDKSEMHLPQDFVNHSRSNGKQVSQYNFFLLYKFTDLLINKPIESISYRIKGGQQKSIAIRSDLSFWLKDGLLCLNPLL